MNSHGRTHEVHEAVAMGAPQIRNMLVRASLRPTRPRLALAGIIFGRGQRHWSAETLQQEAALAGISVSPATIYNTLHQFVDAGLLREVAIDGARTYFDTNISHHHHFVVEDGNILVDIPPEEIGVRHVPEPPLGYTISEVDVLVRLHHVI